MTYYNTNPRGETYESLKFLYRIPAQTIGAIVPETCAAIATVNLKVFLLMHNTISNIPIHVVNLKVNAERG